MSVRAVLSHASHETVQISYRPVPRRSSATLDEDYENFGWGTLTFAPGETEQAVTVTIIGDDEIKGDETFIVLFRQPVNVTFANPNPGTTRFMDAVVTIVDDDPAEDRSRVNQAPTFDEGSETTRELPENTAAGVNVGGPIAAADPDGDALIYSLSGNDSNAFDIDDATGQLLTREGATYDYEAKSSYGLMVEVSDGQGGTASIGATVNLTDVDEAIPLAACSTGHGTLTEAAEFAGPWDDPECAAHHRESRARYVSFTVSQEIAVSISLEGGVLFVSQGTPKNGWGRRPTAAIRTGSTSAGTTASCCTTASMPGRTGSR